jgi:hypothetical protein
MWLDQVSYYSYNQIVSVSPNQANLHICLTQLGQFSYNQITNGIIHCNSRHVRHNYVKKAYPSLHFTSKDAQLQFQLELNLLGL